MVISTQNICLRIKVKLLLLLEYSISSSSCFYIAYIPGSMAFHLFLLYKNAGRVLASTSFPLIGKRMISLSKVKKERMDIMWQRLFHQNINHKNPKHLWLHFLNYSWYTMYTSFSCTAWWVNIYILYNVITTISQVIICHHTKLLW